MEKSLLYPLSVTQERTDKKSVSDFSVRSSMCSLLTPNTEEFYEVCKLQLKVSSRNSSLQQKIK